MNKKKLLAGPYLFWALAFILIPLAMIVYYGLTDANGHLTFENLLAIGTVENFKALCLSLLLSLISTAICLLLAYPLAIILSNMKVGQNGFIVLIFIIPMWMGHGTWFLKIIKTCLVVRTSCRAAFLLVEVSCIDPRDRPDGERGKRLKVLAGELGGVYT